MRLWAQLLLVSDSFALDDMGDGSPGKMAHDDVEVQAYGRDQRLPDGFTDEPGKCHARAVFWKSVTMAAEVLAALLPRHRFRREFDPATGFDELFVKA